MDGERCYWVTDKIAGRVHIPHCWPAVLRGPSYCTCRREREKTYEPPYVMKLLKRIKDLEYRVKLLEANYPTKG